MKTSDRLIDAALGEFAEKGFDGTHTNAIARAAGFAPQTFYRHFPDKLTIFVAVYERWQRDEAQFLKAMLGERRGSRDMAERIVSHHREHRQFRRDLRRLAVETDVVRTARRNSRDKQLDFIGGFDRDRQAARLLQVERLADAIAEGELRDLGLNEGAAIDEIAARIDELRQT